MMADGPSPHVAPAHSHSVDKRHGNVLKIDQYNYVVRACHGTRLMAKEARKRFTKKGEEKGERVLRHRKDEVYASVCRFLDPVDRSCTVYGARPKICRQYPGEPSCGYYDFLSFERRAQDDPEFIPSA